MIWIWLISSLFATEVHFERYCFESATHALQAQPIISNILVKGTDHIETEGECLNVFINPMRVPVLDRWLDARYKHPYTKAFSSTLQDNRHCEMEITTTKNKNQDGQAVSISQPIKAEATQNISQGEDKIMLVGLSGRPMQVTFDRKIYDLICNLKNNNNAVISLNTKVVPSQNLILLPNGTLHQPQAPVEGVLVSTEIELSKGDERDIGHMVKDLNEKSRKISLQNGWQWNETSGHDTSIIKLKLK
jgi:hypothetical protein